jgi:hypothetical protein
VDKKVNILKESDYQNPRREVNATQQKTREEKFVVKT